MADRNGYNPSILQEDTTRCFICGRSDDKLDRHEIYGASNRSRSKRLGLWVVLCRNHHADAHGNKAVMIALKQAGQIAAKHAYGWTNDEFRKKIGRNYL